MSGVVVTLEFVVTGTDDAEAVRTALLTRDSFGLHELEDALWIACADAKVEIDGIDTDRFECEWRP